MIYLSLFENYMNYLKTYESYSLLDYGFHHVDEKIPENINEICLIKHDEDSKILVSKWNGQFNVLEDPHPNGNTPSYYPTYPKYWKSCNDIKSEVDEYLFTLTDELQSDSSQDVVYIDYNRNDVFIISYTNLIITEDKKRYVLNYLSKLEKVLKKEFAIKEIRFNLISNDSPPVFFKFDLNFEELRSYILHVYKNWDIVSDIRIYFQTK